MAVFAAGATFVKHFILPRSFSALIIIIPVNLFIRNIFFARSIGVVVADLTRAEREALAFVYDLRNKFESGEIPIEEEQGGGLLGAFKRAFQPK